MPKRICVTEGCERPIYARRTMNRLAYEDRAQRDGVSVAEARRRIIAKFARDHRLTFAEAATRTERPDGAR